MSQYYKQIKPGGNDARHQLHQRLAREDMGEKAYDEAVSHHNDLAFKKFGVVFIVAFAVVVLGVILLGY